MHGEVRTRFVATDTEQEAAALSAVIEGAIALNMLYLRARPGAPRDLSKEGIQYERPVMCATLCQIVDPIPVILRKRHATCYSVAAWVAACQRFDNGVLVVSDGMPVWAFVDVQPQPDAFDGRFMAHVFHAVVPVPRMTDDGVEWSILDPTSELAGFAEKGKVA